MVLLSISTHVEREHVSAFCNAMFMESSNMHPLTVMTQNNSLVCRRRTIKNMATFLSRLSGWGHSRSIRDWDDLSIFSSNPHIAVLQFSQSCKCLDSRLEVMAKCWSRIRKENFWIDWVMLKPWYQLFSAPTNGQPVGTSRHLDWTASQRTRPRP